MRKLALATGGLLALGLAAVASPASAGTVASSGAALLDAPMAQETVENVYWRRVCRNVRVWRHGRWVWVPRCRSVWIEPRHRYRCGPSWNRHWCWR